MKNEAKTEKDLLQQTKRLLKETKDRIEKMTIDFQIKEQDLKSKLK